MFSSGYRWSICKLSFLICIRHHMVVRDHSTLTKLKLCVILMCATLLLAPTYNSLGRLLKAGTCLIAQPLSTTCCWRVFKRKLLGPTDDLCYNFWKKTTLLSSRGRDLDPVFSCWVDVRQVYIPHLPKRWFLFSLKTNPVPSKRQNLSLGVWRLSCWAIKNDVLPCLHIQTKWTVFSVSAQIKLRLLILSLLSV